MVRKIIQKTTGVIYVLAAIVLSMYCGVWQGFIGGILLLFSSEIVFGIIKIFIGFPLAVYVASFFGRFGLFCIKHDDEY